MTELKAELSVGTVGKPDTFLLGRCAIFWVVAWLSKGTTGSLVENFESM